ncbi:hypothetical protein C7212DRAFT_275288 [Tuber magnatum]|uniref:ABM domain-containing protein n=1 Tax=Tuber magnatum TaxID=42249 RepID=A0A317SYL2_9PEZI|nr:hypothetical protein C7212DRAFT_275288 [Tuber magnatum]
MPVLEFAIFALHPPHTSSSPTVKPILGNALKVLNSASGHPFTPLTQIGSPNKVYLVGAWDSVPTHNSFLASAENQKLLADAKDVIGVDVMYHAEMDRSAVPLGAPVVSIGRHHVRRGMKPAFEGCFQRVREILSGAAGMWEVAGGWRIDEGGEKGCEWLLFAGWESVTQHKEFGRSERYKEYGEIGEFLEGFEVGHAVKYDP